jgi:hypothetical protein
VKRSRRSSITRSFAFLAASVTLCRAQVSSEVSLSSGIRLEIQTNFGDPTGEQNLRVEMARASGDSFYRIFYDQNKLAVFAYELAVERAASDPNALHLTAKPAETEFAARYPNADAGKPVPSLSSDQEFGPLISGKSADLGLFEIPGMGLKVSETIRVTTNQTAGTAGPLRLSDLHVSIDRTAIPGAPPPSAVSGRYVMFYIPGKGGYFFASEPVAGRPFVNAGTIDRNHMRFTVENTDYECTTGASVLTNADSGELWVYHDPSYIPSGNWTLDPQRLTHFAADEIFTSASDSLSWWLP